MLLFVTPSYQRHPPIVYPPMENGARCSVRMMTPSTMNRCEGGFPTASANIVDPWENSERHTMCHSEFPHGQVDRTPDNCKSTQYISHLPVVEQLSWQQSRDVVPFVRCTGNPLSIFLSWCALKSFVRNSSSSFYSWLSSSIFSPPSNPLCTSWSPRCSYSTDISSSSRLSPSETCILAPHLLHTRSDTVLSHTLSLYPSSIYTVSAVSSAYTSAVSASSHLSHPKYGFMHTCSNHQSGSPPSHDSHQKRRTTSTLKLQPVFHSRKFSFCLVLLPACTTEELVQVTMPCPRLEAWVVKRMLLMRLIAIPLRHRH